MLQVLAKNILAQLGDASAVTGHDSSVSISAQEQMLDISTPLTLRILIVPDHRLDPPLPKEQEVKRRWKRKGDKNKPMKEDEDVESG